MASQAFLFILITAKDKIQKHVAQKFMKEVKLLSNLRAFKGRLGSQ